MSAQRCQRRCASLPDGLRHPGGGGAVLPPGRATRSPSSRSATGAGWRSCSRGRPGAARPASSSTWPGGSAVRWSRSPATTISRPATSPGAGWSAAARPCGRTARSRARRGMGAICYLDEVVEARQDVVVVIHPLTDDRRMLPIEKTGELVEAAPGFQLVVSYNPGYQHVLKDLKPSTRQRFVSLEFDFPPPDARAPRSSCTRAAWTSATAARAGGAGAAGCGGSATGAWPRCRAAGCWWPPRGSSRRASTRRRPAGSRSMAPLTDDPDLLAAIGDLITASSDAVAEPEDVIAEGALCATRLARELWARRTAAGNGGSAPTPGPPPPAGAVRRGGVS